MARGDQFIPHLFVSDGRAALEFYKEVFGGEEGDCMLEPNGARLMHGEIVLDGHTLFVSDDYLADRRCRRSRGTRGGARGAHTDAGAGYVLGRALWKDHRSVWARVGHQSTIERDDTRRD